MALALTALVVASGAGCSASHGGDPSLDGGPGRDAVSFDAPYVPPDAPPLDGGCAPNPIVDPRLLPECPFCGGGRCVSGDALSDAQRAQLADCSPSHECIPDEILGTGGNFTLDSCRSVFGVEGRCLSTCLPALMGGAADRLPRGTCSEDHRCVPCFDPLTGADTGVCSLSCDPGPAEPPVVIASCCEDRGYCIPSALIAEDNRGYFEACDADSRCVPRVIVTTPGWTPPACTSSSGGGACLHECMPAVAPYRPFLAQEDCPDDLLCVPCRSPIDGRATGACADVRDDGGIPESDAGASDAGAGDAGAGDAGAGDAGAGDASSDSGGGGE